MKNERNATVITELINSDGITAQSPEDLCEFATAFYSQLYGSETTFPDDQDYFLQLLADDHHVFSSEILEELTAPISNEECEAALRSAPNNKAPGPNEHYYLK